MKQKKHYWKRKEKGYKAEDTGEEFGNDTTTDFLEFNRYYYSTVGEVEND